MTVVRQLERDWDARRYRRILADLLASRVESALLPRLSAGPTGAAAAAIAIVRLDELDLPHVSLYSKLLCVLIAAQLPDGSWGDPAVTALCLRALLTCRGRGVAAEKALNHLAALQRADGSWPEAALRRLPGDAAATAFILLQLGDHPQFAAHCNIPTALTWLASSASLHDPVASRLAAAAQRRLAHAERLAV